jgi:hypothetical protein
MSITDATLAPGSTAPVETLSVDFCVVGGGMAGLCAALAAARHGARTAIIQDRAVFGGNASSEIRMWICGAHGADNKEAGILEEIQLANQYCNPGLKYALWDVVLHGKAREEPNLTTLLSCAVTAVEMDGSRIAAVRAWHLTRQCWVVVKATHFADCSGDSVLRLSGAQCRWGREGREEFDEPAAPAVADRKTMGNSLLLQLRQIDPQSHVPFIPPSWAHRYGDDHPRLGQRGGRPQGDNFWWLEIGGLMDTVADSDRIRDELQRIALGVWAYIKNHPDGRGHGWELEWFGSLPGKRENVRYVGDHLLKQKEVEECGRFDDIIGHGGWTMDDHPPAAFEHRGEPTIFHPAPSPYGIPYRCLYSANVDNLFFAGRNISATHMALSSTRVMATCAVLGQAVGTAAALAVRHGTSPRGIYQRHLRQLQATLMDDDQWLPGFRRSVPALTRQAALTVSAGDGNALRDGIDRRVSGDWHAWTATAGGWATYRFSTPQQVGRVRLVGDSALHACKRMPCSFPAAGNRDEVPATLPRDLRIQVLEADGATWRDAVIITDNHRRLLQIPLDAVTAGVRVVVDRFWGAGEGRLFACEVGEAVLDGEFEPLPWPTQAIKRKGPGA